MNPPLRIHCFVCITCRNKRHEQSNGQQFLENLKELAKAKWPPYMVKINKSGCLGHCDSGLSVVIYPQGKWLSELKTGDEAMIAEVIDQLLKTEAV